ncbi:MAG: CPBP family intramembrane metalloprotease [Gemmatimonadetes bacterium]|nr:CPBP family intramembrane metalloprotease [Gemmatimonadota bacterium]
MDPQTEANREATAAAPGGGRLSLVKLGLLFYGTLFAVALAWSIWSGRSVFYASQAAAERGIAPLLDTGLGLAVAAATIALSRRITERTRWGDAMGRALAELLGERSVRDCVVLAVASGVAEEAFFRGVLQPALGWLLASLIFGLVHFVPKRALLPWTGFALAARLVLGALFESTGNLVAPIVAHVGINAVNLRRLVVRYR